MPDPAASEAVELVLEPDDAERLASLCGPFDENLRLVEEAFDVHLSNRGGRFRIRGTAAQAAAAAAGLRELYAATANRTLTPDSIRDTLAATRSKPEAGHAHARIDIHTPLRSIQPRSGHQRSYVANIRRRDLTFGIGPAGTGKTYLAVACAVEALDREQVRRLVLVRPAVEAGERLGFLPGDFAQKVDPYLRPIYDALYETLGFDRVARLIERGAIEIAPLAYMRGRTLNEAFVILDEAQNTTVEQMRMFLTRIGFGSRAVVTGDITQTDLPVRTRSGLRHAMQVLSGIEEVAINRFDASDIVRHPLVARIVTAYEEAERNDAEK
ncbi:MAG TPA: PhoH family protein [Gammaproteobacteria bacterium]|nr:PhoH family protein [Gammaproteobacteria bacterium]